MDALITSAGSSQGGGTWFYSELFPDVQAPPPISEAEHSHPAKGTYFGHYLMTTPERFTAE